ncbi:MAG: TetR family transcriptional regulator [Nevskia sp.]|nr:TetR family transcriptional regulator [Nevskia sp.]
MSARLNPRPLARVPEPAVPHSRTPRAERKKLRILDAAAEVVARRGYAGATLAEIAAEAGTQAGSIYYHFESREALIEEVMRHGVGLSFAHTRACVERLPRSASPRTRLETAIRAHLEMMLAESGNARATSRLTGQIPPEMWQRVNAVMRAYGAYLDRLIAAAAAAGEIDPAIDRSAFRMLVIGAANWVPEWFRPNGRSSPGQLCDLLVRMAMEGVATRRRSRAAA